MNSTHKGDMRMRTASNFTRIALWAASAAFVLASAVPAYGVPAWSRRYGAPCGLCHSYPSLQLTADGLDFYRRGHRLKNDTYDKDFTHLLSSHVEWEYNLKEGESTAFTRPDLHLHAGGALSPVFSVYADANVNGTDLESIYLQATKEWGDTTYVTARGGKISPTIIRNYGNGLMASASAPSILTDTALGDNPFTPARDSYGVDVAGRWNALFVQAGVINGDNISGQAAVNNHKDVYATAELTLPGSVSGVGLYAYRGGYDLGDPTVTSLFDRYERYGVFANFTRDKFRIAGAYLVGTDRIQTQDDRKLHGFYVQGDVHPFDWLVSFARYDDVTTEGEQGDDRLRKGTLGCSFRVYESDVTGGRLVLEVSRKQEAGVTTNAALFNVLWAF